MSEHAEVVVLGMGPGGEGVAERLATAGVDVIGIEANLVGGECPYWGCVPSKMMIRAADLLAESHRANELAGEVTVRPMWPRVADRIRAEATDNWDDRVAAERFERKGGRLVRGRGRIVAPGQIDVGDRRITADKIVIATGTEPAIPPVEGLADVPYWTNHQAIEATEVPAELIVLGGGAIGAELAQVFNRFGSRVTVVEGLEHLLASEEPEACELISKVFAAEGITVHTQARAERVAADGDSVAVTLGDGATLTGDRLLVATGRRTDLAALGVGAIGIDEHAHHIAVDDHLRCAEHVWAIGDVTEHGGFTHMSMYHAGIVLDDILGRDVTPADYRAVPRVTFTDPEVGSVGLTERAAREQGLTVRTGQSSIPSSSRGWIHKAGNEGLIKVVEDIEAGVLVGATSIGPTGGEVLGLLTLAVHARVPVQQLRHMIYAYPTFHRAVEAALNDLLGG